MDASMTEDPSDGAAAPAWITAGAQYVAEWIRYQFRASQQPGCSIAITCRGEPVLDLVLGRADLARDIALSSEHFYRMASHNKAFTAAGMLLLCERGLASLDDRIDRYIDDLNPQLARATIRQLLSHHAGIKRDGVGYPSLRQPFPDAAGLRTLLGEEPIEGLGVQGKYSNLGFGLAGLVIEAIVSEPYAAWLQREVIEAAGLAHTFANASGVHPDHLAHGHSEAVLLGRRQTWPSDQAIGSLDPAFGLVSIPADLCRFFTQLDPDEGASFLTRASRLEMAQERWEETKGPEPRSYGLGLTMGVSAGWRWFGHIGGFVGMMSRTIVVPREDLAISVVSNAQDGRAATWVDGALRILKWFKADYSPSVHAGDWTGRRWNAWGVLDLVASGDRIVLANPAQSDPFAFVPCIQITGPDTGRLEQCNAFSSCGEPARLVRGVDGRVAALDLAGDLWLPEDAYVAELTEADKA